MTILSELSSSATVENVVVFIADSVRYDALPDPIRNRGVTARTISASTATSSSVPSMMTGMYPATHRVWNFDDTLPDTPALFDGEDRGLVTQNVWQDMSPERRPPLRSLRLTEETALGEVSSPFFIVIHDRGAHGPYDFLNNEFERSDEFFQAYGNRTNELKQLYYRGAEDAGKRFLDMYESMDTEDTLVVFTSDHGELLGEPDRGGLWGHGTPVCPELVEVPTVFLGAGLPEGETIEGLISGVDLAPTLMGAQGQSIPEYVNGVDLWNNPTSSVRVLRTDFWAPSGSVTYGASYAQTDAGGLVHHFGRSAERLLFAAHRQLWVGSQAPANRSLSPRNLIGMVNSYGRQEIVHGDPDRDVLRDAIPEEFARNDQTYNVEGPSKDQLKALGYVE